MCEREIERDREIDREREREREFVCKGREDNLDVPPHVGLPLSPRLGVCVCVCKRERERERERVSERGRGREDNLDVPPHVGLPLFSRLGERGGEDNEDRHLRLHVPDYSDKMTRMK